MGSKVSHGSLPLLGGTTTVVGQVSSIKNATGPMYSSTAQATRSLQASLKRYVPSLLLHPRKECLLLTSRQAFTFVREFVVGNNQTGLVQTVNQSTSVVGGENPSLQQSVIPGQSGIAFGSATTQGQTAWPAATVAAFDSYINLASITGTSDLKSSATATAGAKSAAASDFAPSKTLLTLASFLLVVICL